MIGRKIKETILSGSSEDLPKKAKTATYIVGYRYWRAGNKATLVSPYQSIPWNTSHLDFICSNGHASISSNCGCGLYAFFDRRAAAGDIAGIVIGTGKTIIHEDGFKSEHMQLVALIKRPGISSEIITWTPGRQSSLVQEENEFSKKYGVPLLSEAEAESYYRKLRGNPKGVYPKTVTRSKPSKFRKALVTRFHNVRNWFDWHPALEAIAGLAFLGMVMFGAFVGLNHIFSNSSSVNASAGVSASSADGSLGSNTIIGEQIAPTAQLNQPEEISFAINSATGHSDKFLIYITTQGNYDFAKDYTLGENSTCKVSEVNVLDCGSSVQNKFITLMLTPKTLGLHNYAFNFAAITNPDTQSYWLSGGVSTPLQIAFSQDIKS